MPGTPARGPEFTLGMFSTAGRSPFAGLVVQSTVAPLAALDKLGGITTTAELLDDWDANWPRLQEAAMILSRSLSGTARSSELVDLKALTVHAPVSPRQILCAGANYRRHVVDLRVDQPRAEDAGLSKDERRRKADQFMDERRASGKPFAFSKLPSCVTGPEDPIVLPRGVTQADWELELAVVMGRTARYVTRAEAPSFIAGYTVANDITARDRMRRSDITKGGSDFLAGKSSPGFLPLGPVLVPAAFIPDPQRLQIVLKLNGQVMQNQSTADMIFDVASLIEYLSDCARLFPGDVICTGSPAGNGTHYGRFLRPGDVVEGRIERLGELRNTCIADPAG